MLVFDTSILIDIERKYEPTISKLKGLSKSYPSRPAITFANFSEFLYGALKAKKNKKEVAEELKVYDILHTNVASSELFAEMKLKLEKKGFHIGDFDALIASIVIAHDGTLVTKDKHFNKIDNLKAIFLD